MPQQTVKLFIGYLGPQVEQGNPPLTVVTNNIGNIASQRVDLGKYNLELANAFPENKTFIPPFTLEQWTHLPIFYDGVASHYYSINRVGDSTIQVQLVDNQWNPVELSSLQSDLRIPIEIRVYN